MHNNSQKEWEELFNQLPMETTLRVEPLENAKRRALNAFEGRPALQTRPVTIQSRGHALMRSKAFQGIAAMLVVAYAIWLIQSASPPALALDLIIEKLLHVKSARYDTIVTVEGHSPHKLKGFYLEPAHLREESDSMTTIFDWAARKRIALDPKTKRATVLSLKNFPDELKDGMEKGNWFEGMRQTLRAATTDPNAKVTSLDEKQLDGKTLVGVHIEMPGMPMTIWSDPETQLPVRIESTMAGPPKTEIVMTHFEFDVELDKSMFSVEIPQGYTVADVDVDLTTPSESDLITALRMCTEVSNGDFPSGFDAFSMGKYAARYIHEKGLDKNDAIAEQQQETIKIARGFQFVLMLSHEADAHYARVGVKLGDPDRAVLWFKPRDSEMYRVIFADLSVRETKEMPTVADAIRLSN